MVVHSTLELTTWEFQLFTELTKRLDGALMDPMWSIHDKVSVSFWQAFDYSPKLPHGGCSGMLKVGDPILWAPSQWALKHSLNSPLFKTTSPLISHFEQWPLYTSSTYWVFEDWSNSQWLVWACQIQVSSSQNVSSIWCKFNMHNAAINICISNVHIDHDLYAYWKQIFLVFHLLSVLSSRILNGWTNHSNIKTYEI